MLDLPLWAVGLAIAGLAPFLVRFIAEAIDSLARQRTLRAFASVDATAAATSDVSRGVTKANDEERQS